MEAGPRENGEGQKAGESGACCAGIHPPTTSFPNSAVGESRAVNGSRIRTGSK